MGIIMVYKPTYNWGAPSYSYVLFPSWPGCLLKADPNRAEDLWSIRDVLFLPAPLCHSPLLPHVATSQGPPQDWWSQAKAKASIHLTSLRRSRRVSAFDVLRARAGAEKPRCLCGLPQFVGGGDSAKAHDGVWGKGGAGPLCCVCDPT